MSLKWLVPIAAGLLLGCAEPREISAEAAQKMGEAERRAACAAAADMKHRIGNCGPIRDELERKRCLYDLRLENSIGMQNLSTLQCHTIGN